MKVPYLPSVRLLQKPEAWLWAIAVGLVAFHLNLDWRLTGNIDRLSISVFLWGALGVLLWRRRRCTLDLESGAFSSFLGLTLMALVLLRGVFAYRPDDALHEVLPLFSILGFGLLASGMKGLKQYGQEFVVVVLLALPQTYLSILIENLVQVKLLTAKLSAFVLWYLGFEVSRQGVYVMLPTGSIEINLSCSGLEPMFTLLRLAVLFLVVFPAVRIKKIVVPFVAVFIAFSVNGIRIALLAFLVAFSSQEIFQYWHGGSGAQIFSVISILSFSWFYRSMLRQDEAIRT